MRLGGTNLGHKQGFIGATRGKENLFYKKTPNELVLVSLAKHS